MSVFKFLFNPKVITYSFRKSFVAVNNRAVVQVSNKQAEWLCCSYKPYSTKTVENEVIDNTENKPGKKLDKEEIFEELAQGDPDVLQQLKLIDFEVSYIKESGGKVPEVLSKEDWKELLNKKEMAKVSYLSYKFAIEKKNKSALMKKELNKELNRREKEKCGDFFYGIGRQCIFMRIYERPFNNLLYQRLLGAKSKLVFDCSYQKFMSPKLVSACAKQIASSLLRVKVHPHRCLIDFCNFDKNDLLGQKLPFYYPGIYDGQCFSFTDKNYLSVYPKDKIVYLSPHSNESLNKIRSDEIYVIGAFVDKGTGGKASLVKARNNQVRCAKLPLDEYLHWKSGNKCLPLNTVVDIMCDMFYFKDWAEAFRHIPKRFIYNLDTKRKLIYNGRITLPDYDDEDDDDEDEDDYKL